MERHLHQKKKALIKLCLRITGALQEGNVTYCSRIPKIIQFTFTGKLIHLISFIKTKSIKKVKLFTSGAIEFFHSQSYCKVK